jgi:hypothetical protein
VIERDGVLVSASHHAVEKAAARIPVLRGADRAAANRWVERTAARAISQGRVASNVPVWCLRGTTRRYRAGRQGGVLRFAWNEDETAVFLVRRTSVNAMTDDGASKAKAWVVVTVLVRPGATV